MYSQTKKRLLSPLLSPSVGSFPPPATATASRLQPPCVRHRHWFTPPAALRAPPPPPSSHAPAVVPKPPPHLQQGPHAPADPTCSLQLSPPPACSGQPLIRPPSLWPASPPTYDIKAMASPTSFLPRMSNGKKLCRNLEDDEVPEFGEAPKDINDNSSGQRRDEALLSSLIPNGYIGDKSSFRLSKNECEEGNLGDSMSKVLGSHGITLIICLVALIRPRHLARNHITQSHQFTGKQRKGSLKDDP